MRGSNQEQIIFGKVLRELRLAAGKSQEALALDAGLERTFISMLELGQRCPTLRTLNALSRGLNINLSEMMALYENRLNTATT